MPRNRNRAEEYHRWRQKAMHPKQPLEDCDRWHDCVMEHQGSLFYDPVTGLHNRIFFNDFLRQIQHYRGPIIIAMADCDNLKSVNDLFGHTLGDKVLLILATIFAKIFRAEDTIARWGGDEFACVSTLNHDIKLDRYAIDKRRQLIQATLVFCRLFQQKTGIADIQFTTFLDRLHSIAPDNLRSIIEEFRNLKIDDTLPVDDARPIGLSIGFALSPYQLGKEHNLGETFNRADADMYRHKKAK
jgi:diguanylate cyclase (GGDEF)-like protein